MLLHCGAASCHSGNGSFRVVIVGSRRCNSDFLGIPIFKIVGSVRFVHVGIVGPVGFIFWKAIFNLCYVTSIWGRDVYVGLWLLCCGVDVVKKL